MVQNPVYELLNDVMLETLGQSKVSWSSNTRLAEIEGWNSNKTVTAMLALEKKLGRSLPADALDQITTVAEFSNFAAGQNSAKAISRLQSPFASFESLGDSCEFGILQQYEGLMQPHLLRFASFLGDPAHRLTKLIRAIKDDFDHLADPSLLEVAVPEREWAGAEKEYRITNSYYDMQIHTGFLVSAIGIDEVTEKLRNFSSTLAFLRNRFLYRLQTGQQRWIWKSAVTSREQDVELLFEALQKHGSNTLLWVTPADDSHPPETIVQSRKNFYRGYIWKSNDPWAGDWSEGKAWVSLLNAAASVLSPAPEPTTEVKSASIADGNERYYAEALSLLNEIVALQVDRPDLILHSNMSPADVDGWDSLKHINIIIDVEEKLGISLDQTEIERLRNVGDFVALIAGKIGERDAAADAPDTAPEVPALTADILPIIPVEEYPPDRDFFVLRNKINHHTGVAEPPTIIISGLNKKSVAGIATILNKLCVVLEQSQSLGKLTKDELVGALTNFDYELTSTILDRRNKENKIWGLTIPLLHKWILPEQLSMFRNPHLITVMEDPVAVAADMDVAFDDPEDMRKKYFDAAESEFALLCFVERASCPTLLLSHKNISQFSNQTISAIAKFCNIPTLETVCG